MELVLAILLVIVIGVIFGIGFLVGAKQQSKNNYTKLSDLPDFSHTPTAPTSSMDPKDVENFQKLAGIIPVDKNDEVRDMLVKNNVFNKDKIVDALMKAAENHEFPAPDETINVRTTKIATIDTSFASNDPLLNLPLSRVSDEAKERMAQIAKEDISKQLEENIKKIPIAVQNLMNPETVHESLATTNINKPKRKYSKRKPNIVNQFVSQNRADIEANEAASIQLTGESDSHYYYKTTKYKKK